MTPESRSELSSRATTRLPDLLLKRRKALALASTALGLAGCGMLPGSAQAPAPAPVADRAAVDAKVRSYTSDIELALDTVDRERLRQAREKAAAPAVSTKPAAPATPVASAAPATAESASAAPAQASSGTPAATAGSLVAKLGGVILASSTGSEAAPAHTAATPAHSEATPAHTEATPAHGEAAPARGEAAHTPEKTAPAEKVAEKPVPPAAETATVAKPADAESKLAKPAPNAAVTAPVEPAAPAAASQDAVPAAMGAMTAMANTAELPAVAPAPTSNEPSVDSALAVLQKNVAAHPTLNTALAMALLDGGKSAELAKSLSESDQKVFNDLLSALDSMKAAPAPASTLAQRAAPLVQAAEKWQSDADLSLPRLVLATRVDSFGVYTPVAPVFEQGKRHTVIIYCEVANFTSKKGDDGWYITHLAQQETLATEDGFLVWRPNAEEVEDRSMNQRHDFYLVKKLTIPETLAAGKYTLMMNVTDRTSGKKSIVSVAIELK